MVDRSLSVYLLIYLLEEKRGVLSKERLYSKFTVKDIMDKRLEEHSMAGAISLKGSDVAITKRGRVVAGIFSLNLKLLNLKRNF